MQLTPNSSVFARDYARGVDAPALRPNLIDRHADWSDTSPMLNSGKPTILKTAVALGFTAALAIAPFGILQAQEHEHHDADAGGGKTVTGEVVDLMCYLDHNASGDKHAACASKCIKSGGPVGIVSEGKSYLLVGEHKPMNDELADLAGKTITVKGKLAERGGMSMIENAEIVKK
jgi:hypothetical protein